MQRSPQRIHVDPNSASSCLLLESVHYLPHRVEYVHTHRPQWQRTTSLIMHHKPPLPGFAVRDFSLAEDWTFLNHGSYGAIPRSVQQEQERWRQELERQPVDFLARRWPGLVAEARGQVAPHLGTTSDCMAFVPNATAGIQAIIRSFSWQRGDSILTTNHRYDAVHRILQFAMRRAGGQVIEVDPSANPTPDSLRTALLAACRPHTRMVVLDEITSPTARRLPIKPLIEDLRDRGIMVVVDGAHAPGQIDVALDTMGVDFWVGNLHKWVCAPRGAAVLYAAPQHHDVIRAPITSHGHGLGFHAEFDWTGTFDPSPWLSAPRALAQHEAWGGAELRAAHRQLAGHFRDRLYDALDLPNPAVPGTPHTLAMIAVPLGVPTTHVPAAQHWLAAHKVEAPIIPWQGQTWIRASAFSAYNMPDDIEALIALLPKLRNVLRDGT